MMTCIKFHRNPFVRSSLKFGYNIPGVRSLSIFIILEKFHKSPMGKNEKKTHSKFHGDQMNRSWFKIEGTNG